MIRDTRAGWRHKKVSGETTLTRMWLLSAVAVLLGLVGGGAAVGLFKLISLMTHLALLHDVGFDLPTLRDYRPDWWMVVTVVAGGFVVSLFALWSPVIRGHGIPESLEAILGRDAKIRPRAAIAKPLSAAVTIGTGGPFGAEGPIIVTGGSIGSLIGQVLAVSPAERKIMLATGAAAGMSATFNTPIAAVILAIELVLFERSLRAVVPLSIACGIAAAIHVVAFGTRPLFFVAAHLSVSLAHLPLFAVVGVASGVLAVLLNKGLFVMEAAFRRLPVNIFFWPAIGALGFGLIGLLVPRTLSMGYSAIIDTLNGHFTVTVLAVLFVAKLLSWWIALGSQTSGGTLAPMFLVGATMGCLLGHGFNAIWPGLHVSAAAFALVAMGATFGAATKALFAAVVFATEVTGQYAMAVPLLVAAGVAELVAQACLSDRLMTEKLSHRGFRVEFSTAVDALRMRIVRQVMREPIVVHAGDSLVMARETMAAQGLSVVAVVEGGGRYLGLLRGGGSAADTRVRTAGQAVTTAMPPLAAGEYLSTALEQFISLGVDALPVVEDGEVVGQLDRADIAAERHRCSTVSETRQAGWLTGVRHRFTGGRRRPTGVRRRSTVTAARQGSDRPRDDRSAGARPRKIVISAPSVSARPELAAAQAGSQQMNHRHFVQASTSTHAPGYRSGVAGGRLVPHPDVVEPRLGQFALTERSRIVVAWDSSEATAVAEHLAAALRPATGLRLSVSHGRAYRDDICLRLTGEADREDRDTGSEQGYVLDVGMAGVTLSAASTHGLYHGIQTIRQLLPVWIASPSPMPHAWTMPSTHIVDRPLADLRGLLLDFGEEVPTPQAVESIVDGIAAYKLNLLRLRLPVDLARAITAEGSGTPPDAPSEAARDAAYETAAASAARRWTAGRYERLYRYAAARFVAVIPELAPPAGTADADGAGAANGSGDGAGRDRARLADRLAAMTWSLADEIGGWPAAALRIVAEHRGKDGRVPAVVLGVGGTVPADRSDEPCGIVEVYRSAADGARAPALSAPLPAADRAAVERMVFPRVLALAETAWTRSGRGGDLQDFLARVAPHGAKLALAGTAIDPEPAVPWRVHIAGVRPVVRRRAVSGPLAILTAPGIGRHDLAVEIDWGDGGSSPAFLAETHSAAITVTGSHVYRRAGTYLVAITATASGAVPARTTVPLKVWGLRAVGPGSFATVPAAARRVVPAASGSAIASPIPPVGEGEPAGR